MQIFVKDSDYYIAFKEGKFSVDLAEKILSAESLAQLVDELKKTCEVRLPDTIYFKDLSAAEELLKAGFRYLHVNQIFVEGEIADLRVSLWSSEETNAVDEWRSGHFRFYEARWTNENGKEQSRIYSEAELEGLGKVYRKPTKSSNKTGNAE